MDQTEKFFAEKPSKQLRVYQRPQNKEQKKLAKKAVGEREKIQKLVLHVVVAVELLDFLNFFEKRKFFSCCSFASLCSVSMLNLNFSLFLSKNVLCFSQIISNISKKKKKSCRVG